MGTNNPQPNQAPKLPGDAVKVADDTSLPCFNCGHKLEEHRMSFDYGTSMVQVSSGALKPGVLGRIKSAVMPSTQKWECLSKFCSCKQWQEMDNLGYTAWKRWGNLLFLMRRHGKI